MCGRFFMEDDKGFLCKRYQIKEQDRKSYSCSVKLPSTLVPVIMYDEIEKRNKLVEIKWGWKFLQNKSLQINARSENLFKKPNYSQVMSKSRCIVPANAYYEWDDHKDKFTIAVKGSRVFSMAGLHKRFIDDDNNPFDAVVLITKDADYDLKSIHYRMPLILTPELETLWLQEHTLQQDLFEKTFLKNTIHYKVEKQRKNVEQMTFFD